MLFNGKKLNYDLNRIFLLSTLVDKFLYFDRVPTGVSKSLTKLGRILCLILKSGIWLREVEDSAGTLSYWWHPDVQSSIKTFFLNFLYLILLWQQLKWNCDIDENLQFLWKQIPMSFQSYLSHSNHGRLGRDVYSAEFWVIRVISLVY